MHQLYTLKSHELTQTYINKRCHDATRLCVQDAAFDADTHDGGLDTSTPSPQNHQPDNVLISTEH